jgi:hypothetical protein
VCGGDILGNVFVFEYSSMLLTVAADLDKTIFGASRRLTLSLNYNVGDVVTGVSFTGAVFPSLWYTTVAGAFGGIISLNVPNADSEWAGEHARRIRLLRYIEIDLAGVFLQLTGGDQIEFRQRNYPAVHVIDMDLLECFATLQDERKNRITARVREYCKDKRLPMKQFEMITPAGIEFEIARFAHYFLDWQKKPK